MRAVVERYKLAAMKRNSQMSWWMRACLFAPVAAATVLILLAMLWQKPPGVTFQTVSLPRFEISIAKLPDGSQVRILFDRSTGRDYLTTISARGGVSTVSLPYKDQ